MLPHCPNRPTDSRERFDGGLGNPSESPPRQTRSLVLQVFPFYRSPSDSLLRRYDLIQVIGPVQNLEQQALQPIPERLDFHPLNNVAGKGIGQQRSRILQADTSRPEIKQRVF